MTDIEGMRSRRNFHDARGGHMFPHPRTFARKSDWTAWDRAYAAHLDRHRELAENPEPMDGDLPVVASLFAHIEHLKAIIRKEQQLIVAIRQKAAEGLEIDDKDARTIRRLVEEGS